MVLLNLVRVLISGIALLLILTLSQVLGLEGVSKLLVFLPVVFVAFCAADLSDAWLIGKFNQD